MTDTVINPAYLLRSYIWALLKNNTDMDESDYDGLVPIVPVAEEPELSQYTKPYAVYGYALESSGDRAFASRGSMTLAIYETNFRQLTDIMNILYAAFEREEIAAEVNQYTTNFSVPGQLVNPFLGLRFGFIRMNFLEGGTPEETEGGRQSALISLGFEYYTDYNIKTYRLLPDGVTYGWA